MLKIQYPDLNKKLFKIIAQSCNWTRKLVTKGFLHFLW